MVWVYCGWWCWAVSLDATGILRSFRRGFPGCALADASVDDASRLQLPNPPNCECWSSGETEKQKWDLEGPQIRRNHTIMCQRSSNIDYFHRWLLITYDFLGRRVEEKIEKLQKSSMPSMPASGFPKPHSSATAPKVQSGSQLAGSGSVQPLHNEVWASAVFWRDPAFCDILFNVLGLLDHLACE